MASNWTFGRRLAAGFAVVLTLFGAMGVASIVGLRAVVASKDIVIEVTAQDLIDAETLRAAVHAKSGRGRGYLLTGDERFVVEGEKNRTEFVAVLAAIRERQRDPAVLRLLDAVRDGENAHEQALQRVLEMRRRHDPAETVNAAFDDTTAPSFDAMLVPLREFVSHEQHELEVERAEATRAAENTVGTVIALGVGAALLGIVVAWLLTSGLTRQVGTSVQHVRSSSAELQASASQQAAGAKEQSTAMSEIGTTIGELLATSRQIAESAQRVSKVASETTQSARSGGTGIESSRVALQSIKQQVDLIVQHMLELGRKSQQIGGILEIINELAEQTNILAINATIEAAGAGDSGRRFAVVGDEIRKLADRVGASTKEIRSLIEEVRAAVNSTVMVTETGSKTVDAGTARFSDLAITFQRISDLVETTTQVAREIELSTKQQATAVEQVDVAIANISQASREAAAGTSQTLQTASELAKLSDTLSRLVQARVAS